MFYWQVAPRKGESISEHLDKSREYLDDNNYGNGNHESFFGYKIPNKKLIKDVLKAATRIVKAVKNNEKIVIFGHDDVDGITSTYILFDFLDKIGSYSHYYYIPNRLTDSHGISESFINCVNENNFSLVITVDIGVTSIEGVNKLNDMGCEVIITDHHLISSSNLPNAYAIVNPKRDDCQYPDKTLTGVGIVYFLVSIISELLGITVPDKYIFWTATGTIADKGSMVGINRIICKVVFDNWQKMIDRPLSLWSNCISKKCTTYFDKNHYIYNMAKLLSCGRDINGENKALYFLLAPDYKQREVVTELFKRRSEYESSLTNVRKLLESISPENKDLFYIYIDEKDEIPLIHSGWAVNYMCYLFKIPVIYIKIKGSLVLGECKCIKPFNFVDALDYCKETLCQFGGHNCAAGFISSVDMLSSFRNLFAQYAETQKDVILNGKKIPIDLEVNKEDIPSLKNLIMNYSPFGEDAPIPTFLVKNIKIHQTMPDAVNFSLKEYLPGENYDVVFTYRCNGKMAIIDTKKSSIS